MNFSDWYHDRHGYSPFPWQQQFADRVASGELPSALTPPTGSGKTAVIDAWLWARLHGHPVPTRLVYVIDRRLIVDSVTSYIAALNETLAKDDRPTVVTMRGGIAIDDDWLDPVRPTVIVTTVDQAGSRLLFHGYGVSLRTAPIHAALLGNDALWVLDEVHLAGAFERTLHRVAVLRGGPIPLPFGVLPMSATYESENSLGLSDADYADPVLARRLNATKPVQLRKLKEGDDLPRTLCEEAISLRNSGADVVAVVCNRVATARAAFERLSRDGEAILLTGRIRPTDRVSLLAEYLPRIAVGSRGQRQPLFVVATQTIEVGADLDFDALVTECAPLSALRQRAGRLNRLGELATTPMTVVYQKLRDDPVYRGMTDETWTWLTAAAETMKGRAVDFGIRALSRLTEALPAPLEPEQPSPILLQAHLDILSQTSIDSGLKLDPWLHGWQSAPPDVYLCWRVDPSTESIAAAPPATSELLAVPLHAFRSWAAEIADIDGCGGGSQQEEVHDCIRWDGEVAEKISSTQATPGNTLVLNCRVGGCDRWGWSPQSKAPVNDLGNTEERVRLHPSLHPELANDIAQLLEDEAATSEWRALARRAGLTRPGRVLAYPGGAVVLASSSWTSAAAMRPIGLRAHLGAVGLRAKDLAERCGLAPDLATAVMRAGHAHDQGKADPRWQAAVGGDGVSLLAKGPGGDAGWLSLARGWRHEMASAVEQHEPLVRHLVGSHHGHGRPIFPSAPDIELWRKLSGWSAQFAELQSKYGWWGLAFLEMLVRLADWQISEEEQR